MNGQKITEGNYPHRKIVDEHSIACIKPFDGPCSIQVSTYVRVLARYPWLVALISFTIGVFCVIMSVAVMPLPDFTDPSKGFDSRGTALGMKTRTLQNIFMTKIQEKLNLTLIPNMPMPSGPQEAPKMYKLTDEGVSNPNLVIQKLQNENNKIESTVQKEACHIINNTNLKVVFEKKVKGVDLFSLHAFKSMCKMEAQILKSAQIDPPTETRCSHMISLPLLALFLANKTSCSDLKIKDVSRLKDVLIFCYPYYKSGDIQIPCDKVPCTQVPSNCTDYSIANNAFQYLVDVDFDPTSEKSMLTSSMIIYNFKLQDMADYYIEAFGGNNINDKQVKVVSVYSTETLRTDVFAKYFVVEILMYILGLGLCCLLVILTLYLFSFVILIGTALNIAFSFGLANVVYVYIFQIKFFPFINVLAGIVLLAVGVDAVFIFHDAWKQCNKEFVNMELEKKLALTFRNVGISVLITSLTTTASFFASYITDIVSIQCFAIFSGLCVMANFVFVMTWIPAIIVLESLLSPFLRKYYSSKSMHAWFTKVGNNRRNLSDLISYTSMAIIGGYWYMSALTLMGVGIAGFVSIFYYPKLEAPASSVFPLFIPNTYLDTWQSGVSNRFMYFKVANARNVSIHFVWGVKPTDTRKWYDTTDRGTLELDKDFDFTAEISQMWLKDFHAKVRNNSMYSLTFPGNPNYLSLFEMFEVALQTCDLNTTSVLVQVGCCVEREIPFSKTYMERCLKYLYTSPQVQMFLGHDGSIFPIFDADNRVRIVTIRLDTSRAASPLHKHMAVVYKEVNAFMDDAMESVPVTLSGGFVTSLMDFIAYDLNQLLTSGTYSSVSVSLVSASMFMLLTSLNPMLTVYAILTIVFAISSTVGTLTMMGWELNVVESITMSLSVGLSVDFTIHYGMAYRLSKQHSSCHRTVQAFDHVGSAVLMAATTTFTAGASMLPSHILAYTKLGTFLVLIMCFSWLFSTFFFLSLCYALGPTGNFLQFRFENNKIACD